MHNRRNSKVLAAERIPNELLLLRREQDHGSRAVPHHHGLPVLDGLRRRRWQRVARRRAVDHEAAPRVLADERHGVVGVPAAPRRARGRRQAGVELEEEQVRRRDVGNLAVRDLMDQLRRVREVGELIAVSHVSNGPRGGGGLVEKGEMGMGNVLTSHCGEILI